MALDSGLTIDGATGSGLNDAGFPAQDGRADRDPIFDNPATDDPVIDVDVEDAAEAVDAQFRGARRPRLAERFNTETRFQGLSLSQLAVHSLWIVDYLRQLGETEMADGDIESIARCADDLESAIMLMFQLAGGTRPELRQRYHEIKLAMLARQHMTVDTGRKQ